MLIRRLFGYLVAGVALGLALVYAFWPQPLPVDLAKIEKGHLVVTIDGDGQTIVREIYVVSAPITGRVLRAERHVGDTVIANETVLVTVQPTDPTFLDRRAHAQAASARLDLVGGLASSVAELSHIEALVKIEDINEVMRHPGAFRGRGFGCA